MMQSNCSSQGGEAMNKKIISVLMLLMLSLAACGSRAESVYPENIAPSYDGGYGSGAPEVAREEMSVYPTAAPYAGDKVESGSVEPLQERMVIMNADLTIVIVDPQAKMDEIAAMAESLGGFVVSQNMYQTYLYDGGTAPEGYISIRIPSEKMDTALTQIKADVVEVRNQNRYGQDVTAEYVDLQSRLGALESARDQLEVIMAQATETEDVLNVFNQLQYYNEQIEMVKGQMKYYEESSSYSLINITLVAEETVKPITIGKWTPGKTAAEAIQKLLNFLKGFVDFLVNLVLLVLPILIVVFGPLALVTWLIIRSIKKRKAKKVEQGK